LYHSILVAALSLGIEIISDIELFCREAESPIVAITGSNGKSTVTKLLGDMAKSAGLSVGIGGNIGIPALSILEYSPQLYILELSSFQLETTYSLKATAATVLNVTKDHMDRYPLGIDQYQDTKLRIYRNAQKCIVNNDDPRTMPRHYNRDSIISFGNDTGEYYCDTYQGNVWLYSRGEKLLNTSLMKLAGYHNFKNALASLALADALGLPRDSSLNTLMTFQALPHRFQRVHNINGIIWINDSKSTNVGSTLAALSSVQCKGTLWLLLGGDGKLADFSPLKSYIQGSNIRLFCFGQDAHLLTQLRPEISSSAETMRHAMEKIFKQVRSGDVVLLSPACSSLDQFRSFEQRGEDFVSLSMSFRQST
jgi:UDP-N-acetylmuramoylalanine--D-glutamate ligase